jgi:hypothetical protein
MAMTTLTVSAQESRKATKARKDAVEAKDDLKEANADLREAKMDSAADFRKFKKDAEMKISENQKKIVALKAKKSEDSKEIKAKYDEEVLALEQRNNVMKGKIELANTTKTSNWTSFKREFNHDMDELWNAIKDVGVDNTL